MLFDMLSYSTLHCKTHTQTLFIGTTRCCIAATASVYYHVLAFLCKIKFQMSIYFWQFLTNIFLISHRAHVSRTHVFANRKEKLASGTHQYVTKWWKKNIGMLFVWTVLYCSKLMSRVRYVLVWPFLCGDKKIAFSAFHYEKKSFHEDVMPWLSIYGNLRGKKWQENK